jgi:hypothetical protein
MITAIRMGNLKPHVHDILAAMPRHGQVALGLIIVGDCTYMHAHGQ